jgi:signal peptidase II
MFMLYLFFKLRTASEQILCSLLIGGAISNLLDRFFHGGVVDFIDMHYMNWHWPAFNIADSFISCSAIGLILCNLFSGVRRSG